jgi:uncharacterized protein DUF4259/immunity protein 26 of polymorphic toxin system
MTMPWILSPTSSSQGGRRSAKQWRQRSFPGYFEAPSAARAIAASEVIAAALGHPPNAIPPVEIHGATPKLSELLRLKDAALRSLVRIRSGSELAQLWKDAGEREAWELTLHDIEGRLGRQPQSVPAIPKPRRTRLREGSCFAIPLPSGGFAVGVLSQLLAGKLPFGYFFGPRRAKPPENRELASLNPSDAILRVKFGDTEIQNARWLPLGAIERWSIEDWPTPAHTSGEAGGGLVWRIEYPRDAPKSDPARLQRITEAEAKGLDPDRVMGALALEMALDRQL